jgi:hypothetical protein
MVDAYKVGSLGDIPATEDLIKCIDFTKHSILAQEKNGADDWVRVLFFQKQIIRSGFDYESKMETVQNKLYVFNQIRHNGRYLQS